jgi:beta-lactamase superfamily II metal-dependent hydrolase
MHEVDFLPVESTGATASKCGDAIAVRFTYEQEDRKAVIVIDGGYSDIGDDLKDHIKKYYGTDIINLVVSTHPDADHINGLKRLIEQTTVCKLMIHRPRRHITSVSQFSNIEAVDNLLKLANQRDIPVVEPFEGAQEFGGQLTILGPTEEYYTELVKQHLEEEASGKAGDRRQAHGTKAISLASRALDKVLSWMPVETLTDEGETGPRNDSSAIALLEVDGRRLLFTGDAGMPALERAADYYEYIHLGPFSSYPLSFFQAPHHGSKHNVGRTILNRMLGQRGQPYQDLCGFISSAKTCDDHPSPKVSNALKRRGCRVALTEGKKIWHHHNAPERYDYSPIPQVDWLEEDDD